MTQLKKEAYTVGIICALEIELAAAEAFLDEQHDTLSSAIADFNAYTLGRIGLHNVVLACLPAGGYGTSSASGVAANLTRSFPNVRFGLLIGIGGAAHVKDDDDPDKELRLGDVVVSNPHAEYGGVVQYDHGKLQSQNRFVERGSLNRPPMVLSTAITKVRAHARREGYQVSRLLTEMLQKYPMMKKDYGRPKPETDRLFHNDYEHQSGASNCGKCSAERLISRKQREKPDQPMIHYGLIGSADKLMADAIRRDQLYKEKEIICFEMEAAGLMNHFPCIVIRGISDYADSHKNKQWQGCASAAAAAFAKELLLSIGASQVDTTPQATTAQDRVTIAASNTADEIGRSIQDMGTKVGDTLTSLDTRREKARHDAMCLQDLRVTDPRHDKSRIESSNALYQDSYSWVLDNDHFKEWRTDPEMRLLHIKGDPGKGKTMLLCGIINEMAHTFGAYFFFQERDFRINNATAALRGLLYMLADTRPTLMQYIRPDWDRAGKALFDDANSWVALVKIFENILTDLETTETVIIIDAVNECATDQDKLLELLVQWTAKFKTKWVISSRGGDDVVKYVKRCTNRVRLSLKYNQEAVRGAVKKYIQHKVELLAEHQQYDERVKRSVAKHLHDNANDTFLWVSLVTSNLEKIRKSATIASLSRFPPDLSRLYNQLLTNLLNTDGNGYYQRILAIATLAFRPVTVNELLNLTGVPEGREVTIEDVKDAVRDCKGFLSLRHTIVEFVHQSAKEFILSEAKSIIFPKGIDFVHHEIYHNLIQALSRTLRKDILRLNSEVNSAIAITDVVIPNPNPLYGIEYACFYWPKHLKVSGKHLVLQKQEELGRFLRAHLLHWLEAMSLYGGIPQVIGRLYELDTCDLVKDGLESLQALIRDAHRYSLFFKQMLHKYPLQVYQSGLMFSPTHSLVREAFKRDEPAFVQTKMHAEYEWSSSLTRVWSHDSTITAFAYSFDGEHLACGFQDGMLEMWNIASGVMQRRIHISTIRGFSGSIAVEPRRNSWSYTDLKKDLDQELNLGITSPMCPNMNLEDLEDFDHYTDEERAAASKPASRRNSLVKSGTRTPHPPVSPYGVQQGLPSAISTSGQAGIDTINSITELAFRGEENVVVFIVDGTKVGTWDTDSNELTRRAELDCVSGPGPFIISSHGQYMVCGFDNTFATIYDTQLVLPQPRSLKGLYDKILHITFSPDGYLLACCTTEGLIRIWNAASGEAAGEYDTKNKEVDAMALFPDGKRLVIAERSATDGSHVKMVDIEKGTLSWSIVSSCQRLYISPDSDYLVVVTRGRTVFHDTHDGLVVKDLSDNKDALCVFSRGSEQLALTDSGGFRLFTLHTTKDTDDTDISPAKLSHVRRTYFANDSKLLALESQGMLLEVWDIEKSSMHKSHKFPECYISATSSKEAHFAYITEEGNKIYRLDLKTLNSELWLRLPEEIGRVSFMEFSPDGQYLAAGTITGSVCIWNLKSGKRHPKILCSAQNLALSEVKCLLWSSSSTRIAARFTNEAVGVWDVVKDKELLLKQILTTAGAQLCIAFSPDGHRLVVTHGRIFEIWDVDQPLLVDRVIDRRMTIDAPQYSSMAISNNNHRLACASENGVELWDLQNKVSLLAEPMQLSSFRMSFSQDDTALHLQTGVLRIVEDDDNDEITLSLGSETDIFCTRDWIYRDNKRIMWIPDAYRSQETEYQNGHLILHHDSGRIALMEFLSPEEIEKRSRAKPTLSRAPTLTHIQWQPEPVTNSVKSDGARQFGLVRSRKTSLAIY